jgi:Tfp pilus assembly protein PilF
MTYNWHRAEVYTYLGHGLDIVPALEKSAAALPDEYDPPARIGWVYMQAKKYPEAAQWLDKALAKMYGPRKARYLGLRADVAKALGDTAGEQRFRADAAALAKKE